MSKWNYEEIIITIIAVLNPKGGTSKTTLSINLARAIHERGFSVLVVDSVPQGNARDWHASIYSDLTIYLFQVRVHDDSF